MMLAPNGKRERKFGPCLTASPHQSLCRDVFIKSHITAFFKSLINVFIKSHRINHSVKMSLSSHHRTLTFETHLPSISPADHFFSRRPSGLSVPPPSCQQMIINLRKIGNFRKIPPHVVKISIPPRDIAAKVNGDRFDNGIFPRRKKCSKRGLSSDACKLHALDEVINLNLVMSLFVFVFVYDFSLSLSFVSDSKPE